MHNYLIDLDFDHIMTNEETETTQEFYVHISGSFTYDNEYEEADPSYTWTSYQQGNSEDVSSLVHFLNPIKYKELEEKVAEAVNEHIEKGIQEWMDEGIL